MKYVACLLLLLVNLNVYAKGSPCLSVGVLIKAPYVFYQSERLVGIDIDITRLLLDKLGVCYEFIEMPSLARAKKYLAMGKVNLLANMAYTDSFNRTAIYSGQYRNNIYRLFTTNPQLSERLTLLSLLEQKVVVLFERGSYVGPEVSYLQQQRRFDDSFKEIASIEQRLMMLVKGYADISIENELAAAFFVQTKGLSQIHMLPYLVFEDPAFFTFSRINPELTPEQRQVFDNAIKLNANQISLIVNSYQLNQ